MSGGIEVRRLTPRGVGGVAVVACEGPGAEAVLQRTFVPSHGGGLPAVRRVALGKIVDADGEPVDEVLLVRTAGTRFELGCHGGPGVVEAVVNVLTGAGAVPTSGSLGELGALGGRSSTAKDAKDAKDAEDTKEESAPRDRVQEEAWRALPHAPTEFACQVLLRQLDGALSRAIRAQLDAPDADALRALLATARLGAALAVPPEVALVGLPNAGKSSLMNALLGRERVLVADEAGTTRDAVSDVCELGGVPVRLIDTAGRRAADDAVEAAGIRRGEAAGAAAELRLLVLDATDMTKRGQDPVEATASEARRDSGEGDLTSATRAVDLARHARAPRCLALTKVDLLDTAQRAAVLGWVRDACGGDPLLVSSVTGEGLDAVTEALRVGLVGAPPGDGPVLFTPRQVGLLQGALRALEKGDRPRASRCLEAVVGA